MLCFQFAPWQIDKHDVTLNNTKPYAALFLAFNCAASAPRLGITSILFYTRSFQFIACTNDFCQIPWNNTTKKKAHKIKLTNRNKIGYIKEASVFFIRPLPLYSLTLFEQTFRADFSWAGIKVACSNASSLLELKQTSSCDSLALLSRTIVNVMGRICHKIRTVPYILVSKEIPMEFRKYFHLNSSKTYVWSVFDHYIVF